MYFVSSHFYFWSTVLRLMSNHTDSNDTETLSIIASNTSFSSSVSIAPMDHQYYRNDFPNRGRPNQPFKPSTLNIVNHYIRNVAIVLPRKEEIQGCDPRQVAYQIIRKSFPLVNSETIHELKSLMAVQLSHRTYENYVEEYLGALTAYYSTNDTLLEAFHAVLPDADVLE